MFNKKILVLGNETVDTDSQVTALATSNTTINHGLLINELFEISQPGYYHTTVVDLSPGAIANLANKFDKIMLLDQPHDSYPHAKTLLTTLRLCQDLEQLGVNVEYKNTFSAKNMLYWRDYLNKNKSFCFYPFLSLINYTDFTSHCPKKVVPVKKLSDIQDWSTDPEYNIIRNKMLNGELMPERCSDCYAREAEGQESTRQFETLEWAQRIGATSVEDFLKIKSPLMYEIRPSNKCNIMCRTCDPHHSHLIEKEWKSIGYRNYKEFKFNNTPFDKIDFKSAVSIYVGGGEPTIMPEFYDFLRKCIADNATNFEFNIGSNGLKISDTLLELLDHFSNVCFALSIDGYKQVNDYIRWGSDFDTVIDNSRILRQRGHTVSLQTVFSMWNITRMHELFEFYDSEFPESGCLVNVATGEEDIFMPYNHPCPEMVIKSMELCQKTKVYFNNGRSIKSQVDVLLEHYKNPMYQINVEQLTKFYKFNDMLDQSRQSNLADYIPELAQAKNQL
jgi:hypothetical protein